MKYYPIFLDIANKHCTVIGGGDVARRKVERLLHCGARVTVVSPVLDSALETLRGQGRIEHIADDYDAGYLAESFLVIGATNRGEVNERIARDGRRKGVLVNIVDDPPRCDFILPSLCERGDLAIAVSTAGKSPALAKKIRQDLEKNYGPEYAVLVTIMGDLRDRVIAAGRSSDDNREIFEGLLQTSILEAIRDERWEEVKAIVRDAAGEDVDIPGGR